MGSATLARVRANAEKLGATVDHTPEATIVDAPAGMTWKCTPGLHALVAGHNPRYDGRVSAAYSDLLERVASGVEKCTTPNCDICEESI